MFNDPKYPKQSNEPIWTCPQDAQVKLDRIKSISVEDIVKL